LQVKRRTLGATTKSTPPEKAMRFKLLNFRGDKTSIELFISGVQGWNAALQGILAGASEKANSS
jgi:hypothetical protein